MKLYLMMLIVVSLSGCSNSSDRSGLKDDQADAKALVDELIRIKLTGSGGRLSDAESDRRNVEVTDLMFKISQMGESAGPYIIEKLEDDRLDIAGKWSLVAILGDMGREEYIPTIAPLLQHDNHWMALVAGSALYGIGPAAEAAIVNELDNVRFDHDIREIIRALGLIRATSKVARIEEIASDENGFYWNESITVSTRIDAVEALGRIGSLSSLPALRSVIANSDDTLMVRAANKSVEMINAFSAGGEPHKLRDPAKTTLRFCSYGQQTRCYDPQTTRWTITE